MTQLASTGHNRTGVATSNGRAEAMQAGSDQFEPSSHGSAAGSDKVRVLYAREGQERGVRLGSVPPPRGVKKKLEAMIDTLEGEEPTLLMDKLGERLAFERMGTRLYEALVSKHEAYGSFEGGPQRRELEEILNDEHRHFILLERAIRELGGDPTAVTPSADLGATMSAGIMKVIVEPRSTLLQSLEAILVAELTDNASWENVQDLAARAGKDTLAAAARDALAKEDTHLHRVKAWIRAGYLNG